jgi:hypothetical protein
MSIINLKTSLSLTIKVRVIISRQFGRKEQIVAAEFVNLLWSSRSKGLQTASFNLILLWIDTQI